MRWLIAAACAALLPGCTSLAVADIASQALAKCETARTVELAGGRVWESASVRVECGGGAGVQARWPSP